MIIKNENSIKSSLIYGSLSPTNLPKITELNKIYPEGAYTFESLTIENTPIENNSGVLIVRNSEGKEQIQIVVTKNDPAVLLHRAIKPDNLTTAWTYYLDGKKTKSILDDCHLTTGPNKSVIKELEENVKDIDLSVADNHKLLLKENAVISFTNPTRVGQSGVIIVQGANFITGYNEIIKFRLTPSNLTELEHFAYFVKDETNIIMSRI